MKIDFEKFFNKQAVRDARPMSLSREFEGALERIREEFSKGTVDKAQIAINTVGNLKDQVKDSMDKLIDRDGRLDDMISKADEISDISRSTRDKSRKVHKNAFWGSLQAKLIMAFVALLLIWVILAFFCDGPLIPKCR